jgi:hypothetical protein
MYIKKNVLHALNTLEVDVPKKIFILKIFLNENI